MPGDQALSWPSHRETYAKLASFENTLARISGTISLQESIFGLFWGRQCPTFPLAGVRGRHSSLFRSLNSSVPPWPPNRVHFLRNSAPRLTSPPQTKFVFSIAGAAFPAGQRLGVPASSHTWKLPAPYSPSSWENTSSSNVTLSPAYDSHPLNLHLPSSCQAKRSIKLFGKYSDAVLLAADYVANAAKDGPVLVVAPVRAAADEGPFRLSNRLPRDDGLERRGYARIRQELTR